MKQINADVYVICVCNSKSHKHSIPLSIGIGVVTASVPKQFRVPSLDFKF